ncbi:MAG: shikimate dehydrogenase [Actinomycetota bacterium]|nr:shikimate dehydrogenase [Actinomycetota bacterium]MDQ6948012.1 shikimate dehydrogenase [Actinomycetota bacterium]
MQGGEALLSRGPVRSPPTAATSVLGVIGDPVHRSLSPVLHNAALAETGLNWVYVAFPVAAGDGHRVIDAARVLGVVGLSVTMPHKQAVISELDRVSPTARRLGSVNTVVATHGMMVGDSTDGPGLIDALRSEEAWDPTGRRCVVLGTGGAARAVTLSLAEAGAGQVIVMGRNGDASQVTAALAGHRGRVGEIDEIGDADLVVNATPVGMSRGAGSGGAGSAHSGGAGAAPLPLTLDVTRIGAGQLVVDLIYAPAVTPLLAAAADRGARTANGFGMLLHQAGRQFAAWTGQTAPLQVMADAGRAELARRDQEDRPGGG